MALLHLSELTSVKRVKVTKLNVIFVGQADA